MSNFLKLIKTELKLSIRSFDAVFFGVIMPVLIITVIYIVNKEHITGNFGAYISIGICAIGLMALPLTLADYRDKQILKKLQVTPVSPGKLLAVQVIVQSIMAISSALITAIAAILFFKYQLAGSLLQTLLSYILVLVSIFSIGLLITSIAPTSKKAGFLCSLAYFPMLLLSGTTIPGSVFPEIVQKVTSFLPLTQGIKLLNGVTTGNSIMEYPTQVLVLILIAIISILLSIKLFKWHN